MINAIEARTIAGRKVLLERVLETYEKEIRTVSSNGAFDLKVYHDAVVRMHKLNHLTPKDLEELFRQVATKLESSGFKVGAHSNKLMIDWSKP